MIIKLALQQQSYPNMICLTPSPAQIRSVVRDIKKHLLSLIVCQQNSEIWLFQAKPEETKVSVFSDRHGSGCGISGPWYFLAQPACIRSSLRGAKVVASDNSEGDMKSERRHTRRESELFRCLIDLS